jgi:glycerol-3-phosphate dehydrogenase (NAD(P)+)
VFRGQINLMNFAVVGAGAWGTAFALHHVRTGHAVTLAPRRAEQVAALLAARENTDYLPGIALPSALTIGADLAAALLSADVILLACPTQALRETCARVRAALPAAHRVALIVSLAKGLELGTHLRPSQVIAESLPGVLVGALTGPTNAAEFAQRAIDQLVAFVPGAPFYPHDADPATLRLSFATADVAKIEEGIARLGAAL